VLALTETEPTQTAQRQHVLGRLVYSQSRGARLLRAAVVILAFVLALYGLKLPLGSLLPPLVYRKDFLQEYTLARAIADGFDPYLPTHVLAERYSDSLPLLVFPHPTPHPPTLGMLLLPLALLEYSTAAAVWLGLEIVCLVVSIYLLGRAAGARLSIWATLGIATVLLAWHPVWVELASGQVMVLMLALLAGAWLALRSGRPGLGGALVGLAILIKPVVLPLLLLFLLRRDWRALLGATAVICGGYLVAGYVVGPNKVGSYLTRVLPLVNSTYRGHALNLSISSLGWRVFHGTGSHILPGIVAPPLIESAPAALVTSIGLPCLLLLGACLAVRNQCSLDVSFGVMVGVSVLTVPISWDHYLVLAAIPAAQVIRWLACHHLPSRETNLALIVAVLLIPSWSRLPAVLGVPAEVVGGEITHSFALALLPMLSAVGVGALAWLVAWLGPVEGSTAERRA
jgi:hypothetical protein